MYRNRSWIRKRFSFVMSRSNEKVYENLGFTRRSTCRYAVILDTGAGSSFIHKDALPKMKWKLIKPARSDNRIQDLGNHQVNIAGTVDLYVEVGTQVATIEVYVVDKLGTNVILGCDFCDKNIKEISARRSISELDEGATATGPIVRDTVTISRK